MASQKRSSKESGISFLGGVVDPVAPEQAFFHILPVPFTGQRFAASGMADSPEAILRASQQIESWDGKSIPARHGIHTCKPIDCKGKTEAVLERLATEVAGIISNGKFPVGLGGDGAISFGMVRGILDAGVEDFGVVHIDAQADLKDEDNGDSYSEACVMKRIVDEDVPLFQLGIRSLSKEEADTRKVYGVKFYDADFLVSRNINKIDMPSEFPETVFLSIDIDGFDPSVFPAVDAVPGGLGWWQTLSIIESIAQQATIIGMDLTEHSPLAGQPAYDKAAALLIYKIMGIVERARL